MTGRCLVILLTIAATGLLPPPTPAQPAPSATAPADSALQLVLQLAAQGDAQTRREAAAAMLKDPSPDRMKAMVTILESKGNPEAKMAICEAIADCRGQPAGFVPPLLALLADQSPAVHKTALMALSSYEDPAVGEKLKALLQERQTALLTESHAALMKALYECTAETGRPALLLAWLKQPISLERLTALEIAQQALRKGATDPAVLDQTRSMLDDPDETVRQKAVLVLRTWGLREDAPRLEARLKKEQPPAVREAIYNALGLLGDPASIRAAARGLTDPSASVAAEAATALGRLCDTQPPPEKALLARAVDSLLAASVSPIENAKLRERVIDAMASIADLRFLPLLARHGGSDEAVPAVRQAAIRGLGRTGNTEQIGLVIERLDSDSDAGVREAAAEALGKLGSTAEHLQALRQRLDPKVESAAGVQTKAWEAYLQVFAHLEWPEQRSSLEAWSSADSAAAARRIDLLVCLEKDGSTSKLGATRLAEVREELGDALIAASRPAEAAVVLGRGLEALAAAPPERQARLALKLVESHLRSGAPDKALAVGAGLQHQMSRDAVAARLLRFVESTAESDGAAALVFLDKLKAVIPDQFGPSWTGHFRAVRASIRPAPKTSRGE